jgi:transcriptional antiterminator Rof (Rho-off)
MNKHYKPIACSLHDEYEIAIIHRKYLNIKWLDDTGVNHTDKVLPKDVLVKNKEEFLVAYTQDNRELCIRLDKITLLEKRS